ncbi:hypothetical protein ABZ816_11285 [Actinosynnema sp. NPDC047251]|uniref:Putative membrane protein n=1 Tax=Saccharothrix espanaensis (strain ATCC 51144 / DSM 44229 / JCM 9112 / NBRC 15066 / NRRL 15764) TaxID=1179773 RepID=K0K7P6_SACES|nr:hypothetical protein [Saccharothrix espanaensis]CCH34401.1 putative membrane protein [Saccharothrix espanaensis DSM 44229]
MRVLSPTRSRAPELERAREQARALRAARPDVRDKVVKSLLPTWLTKQYLSSLKRAGAVMVAAGLASYAANLDAPWYYHAVDVLLLVLGLATLWGVLIEIRTRRVEATRLREHGPDEYDTLEDAGVRVATRPWWRNLLGRLFDLAVLALPVLVAVRAWSAGDWLGGLAAIAAIGCVVAATVYYLLAAREVGRWRQDFLIQERLTLPPVREDWQVLLG